MQKVVDFLTANPVFHFATIENNQPRVRPFGFFMMENGKMYFITGVDKKVCKQLKANPRFEICSCNDKGEWLRIAATAVFDATPALVEKAFAAMPMLKDIYGDKNGPQAAMFYASDAEAVLTDMSGNSETVRF